MEKILIIDDEEFIRENVQRVLNEDGYTVLGAAAAHQALEMVAEEDVDLVLLDLNLGTEDGIQVLKELKRIDQDLLVIIITGFGSVETAVEALKLGAFDYIKKPFKADALRVIVRLALQTQTLKREVRNLRRGDLDFFKKVPLVGASPALNHITHQIGEIARHPASTVLITGESGTGKELVAREFIIFPTGRKHRSSASTARRCPSPCWRANCSGMRRGRSPTLPDASRASSRRRTKGRYSWTK